MLDYGGVWNTFGSGRRSAPTEGSPTNSDSRGWAMEKGFLVCHPLFHPFWLLTRFVGYLYVWIDWLALLWVDHVPFMTMSTFTGCIPCNVLPWFQLRPRTTCRLWWRVLGSSRSRTTIQTTRKQAIINFGLYCVHQTQSNFVILPSNHCRSILCFYDIGNWYIFRSMPSTSRKFYLVMQDRIGSNILLQN